MPWFQCWFLYIDPLKQGLKLTEPVFHCETSGLFLYIDPLKQGLKLRPVIPIHILWTGFIHRSIKTRIETLLHRQYHSIHHKGFIHRSIKTRIET